MDSKQIQLIQITVDQFAEQLSYHLNKREKSIFENQIKTQPAPEELLTVEETIKLLKCSKQALWNWRKNGILPSYRLGNRVYYKKSDIFNKLIKQE
ncbi:helix-turn-helix domain-containing protein [Aurantibacter crassamenti]|uniref:helix-turn-helix domain-containing protein n=1 Tax=Aurantibacter crassamenti TaxID=1837375 RepID=UPI0019397B72|nr:helix-turn-helix domain-containing protein [Aurantibacter crassamenti]MBM1105162.1 helix-turn-helix domain-containing protein [Aurantibacter crassamenti]